MKCMASLKDFCLSEAESRVLAYVSRSVSRIVPFAARWRRKRASNLVRVMYDQAAYGASDCVKSLSDTLMYPSGGDDADRLIFDLLQRSQQAVRSSSPVRHHRRGHQRLPTVWRDEWQDSDQASMIDVSASLKAKAVCSTEPSWDDKIT
jgi:hypothetical protein